MPSIVLPIRMPRPMPGPMAARPYPMVATLPVTSASVVGSTMGRSFRSAPARAGRRLVGSRPPQETGRAMGRSVLRFERHVEVDGGEQGEDVRLQRGDQQLE